MATKSLLKMINSCMRNQDYIHASENLLAINFTNIDS